VSNHADQTASPDDLREATRSCGPRAIATLLAVIRNASASPAARLAAANLILEYGWGKPARGLSSKSLEDRRLSEAAKRSAREILARREHRPAQGEAEGPALSEAEGSP
jgi:hypothetical protein